MFPRLAVTAGSYSNILPEPARPLLFAKFFLLQIASFRKRRAHLRPGIPCKKMEASAAGRRSGLEKAGFQKKRLDNFSEENLNRFLIESARGELTHRLAIFSFLVFWFFTPPIVPWIMLTYALLVNMPCIIAQRYNRPRVQRLLKRKQHNIT